MSLEPVQFAAPSAPAPAAFLDRGLGDAVLEVIDAGVVVCDADGAVRFCNAAARQELDTARLLQIVDGRLQPCCGAGSLSTALVSTVLKGTRHVVALRNAKDRLYAVVSPLRSSGGEQMAIVLLGRRSSSSELSIELLGISEGLTSAERRVLADLAAQRKPARIALERSVTIATVRSQISSLYSKLGVKSQQELLCLVGGVPPLALQIFRASSMFPPHRSEV
jgi:DNA-binding CsgD family transcriptional regulator